MDLSQVREDIKIAQEIIDKAPKDDSLCLFHKDSFIYQFSNEEISSYQAYLQNKDKILSVTGSGDQILTSILFGTKEIDSFDISRFPKYYLELKKAAILSLSKGDFLQLFSQEAWISRSNEYNSSEIYAGLSHHLKASDKLFWDEIFQNRGFFEVYDSYLFLSTGLNAERLIANIPYLQTDNYERLKKKLKEVEIQYKVGDIFDLVSSLDGEYDLVYLSNIIDYIQGRFHKYEDLLKEFHLTNKGTILTYMFTCLSKDYDLKNSSMEHELHPARKKRLSKVVPPTYFMISKKK